MLNALKYHSVIAAITNVIISSYARTKSLSHANFENCFREYIKNLMEDKNNSIPEYEAIHKVSYMLWVAAIKSKDHIKPRAIAKRIIAKYGHIGFCPDPIDFHGKEINELDEELDEWLNGWTFSSGKTFVVKILLLNLLLSQREGCADAYKASQTILKLNSALTYRLDAGKLQLDHLEANKYNPANGQGYYSYDDIEKRTRDVNSYLGNFMILDSIDNNSKNNVPLVHAMKYYKKISGSWLVDDINRMIQDASFFDKSKNIPKEDFFKERSKRMKKYFKAFLNRQLSQTQITVDF